MSACLATLAALLIVLAAPLIATAQTLGTYDDFATTTIDGLKWRGVEINTRLTGPANTVLVNGEAVRKITNGQLQVTLTTHGGSATSSGVTGEGRNTLRINHPKLLDNSPKITTVQAKVTVRSASVDDCLDNASASRTAAIVRGVFFNDGTSVNPANLQGDVVAGVALEVNSKEAQPRIVAFLQKCTSTDCNVVTPLVADVVFSRGWTVNGVNTVKIGWNLNLNKFIFTVSGESQNETREIGYAGVALTTSPTADEGKPPKHLVREVGVSNVLATCVGASPRASMDVRFDNVQMPTNVIDHIQ